MPPTPHPNRIWIYDTTLRDGSQREGLALSVEDKLRIAQELDRLGVPFIEAGWPWGESKGCAVVLAAEGRTLDPGGGGGLLLYSATGAGGG